jgi:hypothetical protein
MYLNEQLLKRLAQDRTRELTSEARRFRQQRALSGGWRTRAAKGLKALAERLEPGAATPLSRKVTF